MPLYEYKCHSCGYQFETRQGFNDAEMVTCPNCGKPALQRLIQPASIVFKGSGFYVTDHKGSSPTTTSVHKEEGDSAPTADKSAADKSEAKTGDAAPATAPKASDSNSAANSTSGSTSSTGSAASGTAAAS